MRIASVGISNFRCLRQVDLDFDEVTTFIGPNGAGKSSILRALNWFFSGDKSELSAEDVYSGAPQDEQRIRVRVTFDRLTDGDRNALGQKYAPGEVDTFTAWRTWEDGSDKITGKALAFRPFEAVRSAQGADAKKAALAQAREAHPDFGLPIWKSLSATAEAMDEWERAHPEDLEEAEVSDTHFFGFHGQGKLSGLFDYVLVTADLRASEESVDGRNTIIGRILERAVDRDAADEAFRCLAQEVTTRQEQINDTHLTGQLNDLADALSREVGAFTTGRQVQLRASAPEVRPLPTRVDVKIRDELVETTVERQGHGFQRALLISSLKLLASRGAKTGDGSVICLAIEEPELFQHPTQAKVFAAVLRALAQDESNGLQVAYATHSPYFIEPRYFDQVRRVSRERVTIGEHADVRIFHASMDRVCQRLSGYVKEEAIRSRFHQVCIRNLSEALFAEAVALVEGDDDKAVLDGIAARSVSLAHHGIAVAAANGKDNLLVPYAILEGLGIPALIAFDNDKDLRTRMAGSGRAEKDIAAAEAAHRTVNHRLLKYFGLPEEDYPEGLLSSALVAIPDTLEALIETDWPEWKPTKDKIIGEGRGVRSKNAATYALAAEECTVEPAGMLASIVRAVRSLTEPQEV
ncbi:MAG: AAA family ATPase [Acidimicrobiales bacterium]